MREPIFGAIDVRPGKTYTSYRARWSLNGVRQPTRTFDSWDEACDFLDEIGLRLRRGERVADYKKAQTPFRDFAETWYAGLSQRPQDRSTRKKQRSILDSQLLPAFGDRRIGEITRADIQGWVNAHPGEPESIRNYHALLGRIMREAQLDGYLPNGLPMGSRLIALPTPEDRAVILEEAELARLLKKARKKFPERYAMIHLDAHTGLRLGELLALHRTNYIKKDGYLLVRHGLGARGEIGQTKTRKARRVDLSDCCVAVLDAHLKSHDHDLIFPSATGGPLSGGNFRRRVWGPLTEAAGFPGLHFHDLRHSHTSILLAAGWDPVTVAERLGHASAKMTLDRYGHAIKGRQRSLMNQTNPFEKKGKKKKGA